MGGSRFINLFGKPRSGGGPPPPYTAKAVHFDANTSLGISSLGGVGASPLLSFAGWFNFDAGSLSKGDYLISPDTSGYTITILPSVNGTIPTLFVVDQNSNSVAGTVDSLVEGVWVWIGCAIDAATPKQTMFFGNADQMPTNSGITGFDFTGLPFALPDTVGDGVMPVSVVDPVWYPGQYIDFSNLSTRRKFIDALGKPANPSGFPPGAVVLFSGDDTTFATNRGTGGPFTLTGALTTVPGPP